MLRIFTIEAARPAAKPYKLTDGNGLHLLIEPNGSRLWRFRYHFAGKEKMISFGAFPDVSLGWLDELRDDAEFNIASYVDCFLSENLARRYIAERKLALVQGVKKEADNWRAAESQKKTKANLSYEIRKSDKDIDYLGMDALSVTVEGKKANAGEQSLTLDAIEYAPVRNVVGHTGLLTDNGKGLLRLKYENIKARVKKLVAEKPPAKKKSGAKRRARRK